MSTTVFSPQTPNSLKQSIKSILSQQQIRSPLASAKVSANIRLMQQHFSDQLQPQFPQPNQQVPNSPFNYKHNKISEQVQTLIQLDPSDESLTSQQNVKEYVNNLKKSKLRELVGTIDTTKVPTVSKFPKLSDFQNELSHSTTNRIQFSNLTESANCESNIDSNADSDSYLLTTRSLRKTVKKEKELTIEDFKRVKRSPLIKADQMQTKEFIELQTSPKIKISKEKVNFAEMELKRKIMKIEFAERQERLKLQQMQQVRQPQRLNEPAQNKPITNEPVYNLQQQQPDEVGQNLTLLTQSKPSLDLFGLDDDEVEVFGNP
ncbi:Hypothetical_protein [Hexamita inflata]|uniref:Hypothetical_protein n=1 Tax=Hexamita inflata TaxID=28002 RepID=A0AA86UAU4_9EUKA|nr:Hypothetical protein HINF_LOCUS38055 [Hexamita inflata]